jgi:hypothetical protein
MTRREELSLPEDLSELGERLAEARLELSPLELDGIKARAIAQAGRAKRPGKGHFMRRRLATIMASFALVLGGTGIVWAAKGGSPGHGGSSGSAPHQQYCPPSSNQGGKNKTPPPGNKCG